MARPKLPPKKAQSFDFALMPPDKGFVRKTVLSAIDELGIRPVESPATVTITWAEPNMRHPHPKISEGIMAMYEALADKGIIDRHGGVSLNAHQRVNARTPHIGLVIEGRIMDHAHTPAARAASPRERIPEAAL